MQAQRITFRGTPEQNQALAELAADLGVTQSHIIRVAIQGVLDGVVAVSPKSPRRALARQ